MSKLCSEAALDLVEQAGRGSGAHRYCCDPVLGCLSPLFGLFPGTSLATTGDKAVLWLGEALGCIYIYVCMCVCLCVYIYIYSIYKYIFK